MFFIKGLTHCSRQSESVVRGKTWFINTHALNQLTDLTSVQLSVQRSLQEINCCEYINFLLTLSLDALVRLDLPSANRCRNISARGVLF